MKIGATIAWAGFLIACLSVDTIPWWASVGCAIFVGTVFAIGLQQTED
jgi:hypothetical protein